MSVYVGTYLLCLKPKIEKTEIVGYKCKNNHSFYSEKSYCSKCGQKLSPEKKTTKGRFLSIYSLPDVIENNNFSVAFQENNVEKYEDYHIFLIHHKNVSIVLDRYDTENTYNIPDRKSMLDLKEMYKNVVDVLQEIYDSVEVKHGCVLYR